MNISKTIKLIKEAGQDFEFYPTTLEMAQVIFNNMNYTESMLDIGCGNGNLFKKIESLYKVDNSGRFKKKISRKFGIEKSDILINECPSDIVIVGTDFHNNTLIDKQVDVIFSNPPYSEFEDWATKIIKEAYCRECFLILPLRWKESQKIQDALNFRNFNAISIWSGDFLDAERKARAKIQIIKIDCTKKDDYYKEAQDPFFSWFKETFKINAKEDNKASWGEREEKEKEIRQEIVKGGDLVKTLCELYRKDLAKLCENYQMLGELETDIFNELNISLDNLMKACKEKIKGLKKLYWQELFDNLKKITSRLTRERRKNLLDQLNSNTGIDFEESNIYSVVIWVIKNSNQYFESQVADIFKSFCDQENIRNYKSNQRTWEQDRWRFNQQQSSHYTLELRIIKMVGDINGYYGYEQGSSHVYHKINDIFVIAKNLGFDVIDDNFTSHNLVYGTYDFNAIYNGKKIEFLKLKIYKNGNGHFKFNKEFMKRFNIEASRILGWIKSPQDAVDEFEGDVKPTFEEAKQYFKTNFAINSEPKQLLLTN